MKEIKLLQKIAPEILEVIDKRYEILKTIYYKQPIGRRVLANYMEMGERIVRSEINILKEQKLINIDSVGMSITEEGKHILKEFQEFIYEMRGLSKVEKIIEEKLFIKKVILVPGSVDKEKNVMHDLGRKAANYLMSLMNENNVISLTGGTTVKEVIDSININNKFKNVTIVPARGGLGKNINTQANTLAANFANKLNCNYKFLHMPDNVSDKIAKIINEEYSIKEVLDLINKSDILLFGIGRADKMAIKRGESEEKINEIKNLGAVGEAFGYYFDKNGEMIYSAPSIGIKINQIEKIKVTIAVAAGKEKAEAIFSVMKNRKNTVLITDENTAKEIIKLF